MNMLKKGPELKLSDLKVPDFLLDIYYDLRERHLLPLVAILLVALVALPIALSRGSSEPEPSESNAVATPSSVVPTSDLVVAKATPGLRDYRRRLGNRTPQDPFVQQYTGGGEEAGAIASAQSGVALSDGGDSEAVASEGGEVTIGGSSAPLPEASSPPIESDSAGDATEGKTATKYAADTIDVRIVRVNSGDEAGASKVDPTVLRKVPELSMLPSRKTPVAVFMGASADGKKALLLISSDVQSTFGDGRCVVGSKVCQLMAMEEGLPQTFVYGPQARTYRLEILKIDRTLSDEPERASLGEPKKKSD